MRNSPHDKKSLKKPPLYKVGYTEEQKSLYKYNIFWSLGPTLGYTYRKPTKLNYTQRIGFKNVGTVSPKRNVEMKQISHYLWCLPSVLENPVFLSLYNPQKRDSWDPPNGHAFNRVPKALETNHHHIVDIVWLNPRHPSLWEYPMPQSQSNWTM